MLNQRCGCRGLSGAEVQERRRVDSEHMKWLLTTFIALLILTALQPWLQKLGIGRLPGDVRISRKGRDIVLPFTSTVLLSLLLSLFARLL